MVAAVAIESARAADDTPNVIERRHRAFQSEIEVVSAAAHRREGKFEDVGDLPGALAVLGARMRVHAIIQEATVARACESKRFESKLHDAWLLDGRRLRAALERVAVAARAVTADPMLSARALDLVARVEDHLRLEEDEVAPWVVED